MPAGAAAALQGAPVLHGRGCGGAAVPRGPCVRSPHPGPVPGTRGPAGPEWGVHAASLPQRPHGPHPGGPGRHLLCFWCSCGAWNGEVTLQAFLNGRMDGEFTLQAFLNSRIDLTQVAVQQRTWQPKSRVRGCVPGGAEMGVHAASLSRRPNGPHPGDLGICVFEVLMAA